MNACKFNAVTHGILIGVISFTAGAALTVGVASVWFHAAAAAKDAPAIRACHAGFPSDPAGPMPVTAGATATANPRKA
ncbi:MAG: hypothetical protein K0S00_118 [Xanthobacteraceae bacterium]|jgi:hypothetical protein|nr:hypothetical protein [Xanthobacteraceae bacterium]